MAKHEFSGLLGVKQTLVSSISFEASQEPEKSKESIFMFAESEEEKNVKKKTLEVAICGIH